ncbi:MAG: hypothetical protein ACR2PS_13825 [Pseudomonadales bacterium]
MKSVKNCYTGLVLTGMLSLSACSGGGGGSDDNPAPAAPTSTPVVITPTNASKVSAEAYDATISTRNLGANGLGSAGITAALVSADGDGFDLFEFTRQQISRLPELGGQFADNMLSAVTISATTVECESGGTLTISGEVTDPETPTAGDTLTIELNNCADISGQVNGQLSMRFNSISGDPLGETFSFDVTLTMVNFSVTQSGVTSSGDGDMRLAFRTLSETEIEASLTGTSLTLTGGGATSTLSNFSIVETLNEATGASSTDSSGTLASTEIGGSLSFETTVPFQIVGDDYPFAGTLVITGADGSSLQFITLDSVNVQLDIDTDGDGNIDDSVDTTWAALEQQ